MLTIPPIGIEKYRGHIERIDARDARILPAPSPEVAPRRRLIMNLGDAAPIELGGQVDEERDDGGFEAERLDNDGISREPIRDALPFDGYTGNYMRWLTRNEDGGPDRDPNHNPISHQETNPGHARKRLGW
ncbi:hypothetical protein P12x_001430 [Tundrisphaera lichenicola]|uniref:hypothetical protein n=1 Tax=Tundrisphaera lichenicola TaxID=2029860 RepID=UPI003EB8B72A